MTTEPKESTAAVAGQNLAGKYLTFILVGESRGLKQLSFIKMAK